MLCSLLAAGLLLAGGWVASLASARSLADGGLARERAAGVSVQAPLPATPSRTQPYAACPRPKPRHAACQSIVVPPGAKLLALPASALPATSGMDGSGLTPAELESAYALPSTSAGEGQTVALVDAYDDPTAESDLATYRSAYGLPPCSGESGCFRKVNQRGGTAYPPVAKAEDGDWELEESLDLDMVSAICPHCHVLLVEAESNSFENLATAEQEAVALGATEISNSWGSPEFAGETSLDEVFHHAGIPITAASGDDGYDNHEIGAGAPSYPAASPYVIAVGGTVLAPAKDARGWSESVWSRSGSGCSLYEPKPSYQTDSGCSRRTSNDVAAVAEDLSVYDTTHATGYGGLPAWLAVDGTSASTPIVAAVEALSESAERELGPEAFYKSPGSLFDIVSGSNGACAQAYLCKAGGGYDGPTGNGTPDGALSLYAPSPPPQLSIDLEGTGSGSVSSSPAGIECGSTCDASLPLGTRITLTATPSAGSTFAGWQGPCSGTGTCTLTLNAGASLSAVFRGAGTPAGWSEHTLSAPAEREPFLAGSSVSETFYNVSLSASGEVRAKTIYNPPSGSCYYASSNTGGVYLERKQGSSWIAEGALTAPALGSGSEARWANCDGFGEVTKLSADGSTLLVSQDMAPDDKCAAFVYHRGPSGWALQGTLLPPGVEASGAGTEATCDYFGIEGAISDDGSHVAVLSDGRVEVFAREASTWSLEQNVVLPAGSGCTALIGPRELALSGDASTMLVGESPCEKEGKYDVGRAYVYTRSDAGWSLAQTLEAPEPLERVEFGKVVALSDDGSTAAIAVRGGAGLPTEAGAVWVYEHGAGGWHTSARLSDPTPESDVSFQCPTIVGGGARLLCDAYDAVGFNANQGSIYALERPAGGWGSGAAASERAFATYGFAGDDLGISGRLRWKLDAASADGGVIDAPISFTNIADGLYPDDLLGYEFTAPPVYSQPTITSFSPPSGGSGTQVAIAGTNLNGASSVSFAGTEASTYEARSPTQILATVPIGAGSGPISVTTPGGSATSAESFAFVKPETPPHVSSIEPSEGPIAGGTAVTIDGSHFVPGASVTIGGAASDVEVRSESEIVAVTPPEPAGSYEVIVSDEAGSSSEGPRYTFVAPVPVVTSITPSEGPAAGGTVVTITGAHFRSGASVTIGGAASEVSVRSETEITARTSAQPPGSYDVVVSDELGSSSGGVSYTYLPAPTVSSITPQAGGASGANPVTIVGSHFLPGATVAIDGQKLLDHVVSGTEITAVTTATPPGFYEVIVSDQGGSSTGGPLYRYVAAPTVSSVSPSSGPARGGTKLTITGSNFVQAAAVVFIGSGEAIPHVLSEKKMKVTAPAQPAGSYEVLFNDAGGWTTSGPTYTYLASPAPSVTSVSPPEGATAGGTALTIYGSGFVKGAKVIIGPKGHARSVSVVSEDEITASTRGEPAGSYEVVVSDKLGTSRGGPSFTYSADPTFAAWAALGASSPLLAAVAQRWPAATG